MENTDLSSLKLDESAEISKAKAVLCVQSKYIQV